MKVDFKITLFKVIFSLTLLIVTSISLVLLGAKNRELIKDYYYQAIGFGDKYINLAIGEPDSINRTKFHGYTDLNNYRSEAQEYFLKDKLNLGANGHLVVLKNTVVNDSGINIITNSGLFIKLDTQLKVKKMQLIGNLLKNFEFQRFDYGIIGVLWLEAEKILVYYTSAIPGKPELMSAELSILDLKDNSLLDSVSLGSEKIGSGNLGGGVALDPKSDRAVLAIGDFGLPEKLETWKKAQDDHLKFGKILAVNLDAEKTRIVSVELLGKGTRNPQGLVINDSGIFFVEHGPKGGDELNKLISNSNFGWPLRSYGTGYVPPYDRYDLPGEYFTDPLFYFSPSIAPSSLANCSSFFKDSGYTGCMVIGALRGKGILFLKFDPTMKFIQSYEKLDLDRRIRDIKVHENNVYAFTDKLSVIKITYTRFQ